MFAALPFAAGYFAQGPMSVDTTYQPVWVTFEDVTALWPQAIAVAFAAPALEAPTAIWPAVVDVDFDPD